MTKEKSTPSSDITIRAYALLKTTEYKSESYTETNLYSTLAQARNRMEEEYKATLLYFTSNNEDDDEITGAVESNAAGITIAYGRESYMWEITEHEILYSKTEFCDALKTGKNINVTVTH